jgi:PAS domain S-box-containing protein
MIDKQKSKQELIQELDLLRQRVAALEQSELARKRAEEALRDSEEKFRTLFEGSRDAIHINTREGEFMDLNKSALDLFGYTREEFMKLKAQELYACPEDRSNFQQEIEKRGFVRDYEVKFRKKDGTEMDCLLTTTMWRSKDGKILGYHGINRDITERKRAEEVARESKEFVENLIASMHDGFSVLDSDGVHIDVNAAFCQMTGFSREELIGVGPPHPYWPPEAHEETERAFRKTVQGEFSDIELTFMRKNGERFPVIVSPSWVKDKQGNVISYFATIKDITERKRAEEALIKSELRFRNCFDLPLIGFAITSPEKGWIEVNDRICSILGYSRDEIVRKSWPELTHPDDLAADIEQFNLVLSGQIEKYSMDKRFIRKDGEIVWTSISVGCVREPDGRVDYIIGLMEDITERKRAEEALRENERRYRLLAENVSDVIWTMDMNFKYTYLSPSVQRLRGYSVEEAMAQKIEDVLTPTSLKVIGEVLLEERGLESSEQKDLSRSRTVLLELKCKDGTTVWTEVKITTLRDSDGQPIEFIGVTRDITERKQAEKVLQESEERYRSILDNIEEGYFEVDLAGNFTFFNDSLCRELGYSQEEMMGMNNRQYMDKENVKEVYQAFNRVYTTGESYKAYDWGIIRKDGPKRIHESSISLMRDAQGERIGFRGVTRDVTEKKRAEEEREKLVRDLQKALSEVKTLKGIFPICASCKKIRDDKGYWNQVEVYIRDRSEAEFSHGICPDCMKKLYGDILGEKGSSSE